MYQEIRAIMEIALIIIQDEGSIHDSDINDMIINIVNDNLHYNFMDMTTISTVINNGSMDYNNDNIHLLL